MSENKHTNTDSAVSEIDAGNRFQFGKNWASFLKTLNQAKIDVALKSIVDLFGEESLRGKTFLDIGCGSGLFSLCAYQLGARVVSIDFDPQSVNCANHLKSIYAKDPERWAVIQGSALDITFMESLGTFDYVYSYGVLHHTGNMWGAINNSMERVKPEGNFFISIYNDQGKYSRRWLKVKKLYNKSPWLFKQIMMGWYIIRFTGIGTVKEIILLRPFKEWREYKRNRGMSKIHNIRDWIGGLPFEVSTPEKIIFHFLDRGWKLRHFVSSNGIGLNDFVFERGNAAESR
jgi:2-polyprenyl-3-methyl-5-hydroxy-6-metoxy-1,4-benzoquinol methylase